MNCHRVDVKATREKVEYHVPTFLENIENHFREMGYAEGTPGIGGGFQASYDQPHTHTHTHTHTPPTHTRTEQRRYQTILCCCWCCTLVMETDNFVGGKVRRMDG